MLKHLTPLPGAALAMLAGAALFAAPLRAQELESDTLPVYRLAPVVVDVFRIPYLLEQVPYAASVVGEAQIRQGKPGLALDEALRGVPGVQVDNRHIYALGERISIRGFGARAQFGVRGIKVVTDGIPATFPDGQTALEIIDPGMLGRAEVIRGPASAIYGNSAGGVIAFRETLPADEPFHQRYRAIGGENGLRRLEGRLSGRSGAADYRLGVSHFAYAGFREHSAATHLRASGQFGYSLAGGRLRLMGSLLDFEAENPGALTFAAFQETPLQAVPINVTRRTGKEGNQRQLGLGWTGPLGDGELELLGYGISRWVRNPIVPFIIDLDRGAAGVRGLYRGSVGILTRWAVGVDLDLQRDDRQNFVNASGEPGALTRDQREWVRGSAPFLHLATTPLPGLQLMGGVRYDHFRFRVEDRMPAVEGRPDESGERVMAAWSPSVGALFEWLPALSFYANAATAFETPTTTELANRPEEAGGFNPDLEPQRTLSFELGARGALGAAGYQIALYRAQVENALIPFEVLNVPGRTFFRNAGTALHRGVEASGWWQPLGQLTTQLTYTYTDAAFRDYQVGAVRHDGNRVPGVAPHRIEALVRYGRAAGFYVGAEGRYVSRTPVDDANSEFAPEYTLVDLRLGHERWRIGRVAISPFVGINNLLDRQYVASVVPNATAAAGLPRPYYEPGPGRALYLGVETNIGR